VKLWQFGGKVFPDSTKYEPGREDRRSTIMDVTQLRQNLVARLGELGRRVHDYECVLREPLDADFAEQATQIEGYEATADLEQAAILEAEKIKFAVSRIDAGSYGECESCGSRINPKRLQALPYATDCINCASKKT
jgi:RNA polymerase-binding transcription factor DksA